MKRRVIRCLAAGLCALLAAGALADEAGWEEKTELPVPAAQEDKTGFVSGYLVLRRGAVVYRDANRQDALGYPSEESVVYATRSRVYEKGCVYQVRFDTPGTQEKDKCVTAYYYTRDPVAAEEGEISAQLSLGVRVADGVLIPLIRFHYGAETGAESKFNVITASGEACVAKGGTNLRMGPGTDYGYIVQLPRGAQVKITGLCIRADTTWYYVTDEDGNRGFVREDLLTEPPRGAGETPDGGQDAPGGTETPEGGPETEAPPETLEETEPPENGPDAEEPEAGEAERQGEPEEEPKEPEEPEEPEETDGAADAPAGGTEPPEEAAEPAPRGVSLRVRRAQENGEEIAELSAELTGYDGAECALQWQTSADGETWTDVPGATGRTLTLRMTEQNRENYWRVQVTSED